MDEETIGILSDTVRRRSALMQHTNGFLPLFIDVGPVSVILVGLPSGLCYQSLYKVAFRSAVGFVTIPVELDQ